MNPKADLKIIGQMVFAVNLLPIYPSREKAGEFLVALLKDVPGCLRAGICFRSPPGPADVAYGGQCRACAMRRERLGGDEPYPCALNGTRNILAYPFETAARLYGYFVLTVEDAAEFGQYVPFIKNLANNLALTLENRRQQQEQRAAAEILEQRVKERTAELEEKKNEMEKFLYVATHDLRTPLVNIQGYSGMLGKYLKELQSALAQAALSEELKKKTVELMAESMPEALGYITGGTLKMNQLINALLKVARVGRLIMCPKPLDMTAVIKSVTDTFAFELERTGAALTVEQLPSCTADAVAISQVFANLISNAVKYRDPDRELQITVTGRLKDPATALYTVANNGFSIPATDLPKIWDLFYSSSSQNATGEKGEGIGLTVAKRIISLSGGNIYAESKEGAGAVFFIELPV